ncbi:hypothetical protein LV89_01099 [Arcicella aurantiaca]|uniref:Uncharacterized protein n=1 Tax=Arcicella aurantiaca TaxID=591202 RepID=A0A316EDT4_9BACT|nr:hypothetical protein [Arcicella aurantiaca]PWK28316.1 hypothetical protein LV89_01099 [Arcicella aurantiaca]
MTESTNMILKGAVISAFLLLTTCHIEAQSPSNEPKKKVSKNAENAFKVTLSEDEKNPLNLKVNISNPSKETIKVYLRKRNDYTFLFEKLLGKENKASMLLELSPLEDEDYTFVVKTENNFFIKHISLQSGDLTTTKVNGKEVMTTNRTIVLKDE